MANWRDHFQITLQVLAENGLAHLAQAFESELFSQSMPLDFCWFPAFLKMQGVAPQILVGAEVEYLRGHAKRVSLGRPRLDVKQVGLNPSVQFLEVPQRLNSFGLEPGLYCFVNIEGTVKEFTLSLPEALVVDLLREERKYSLEQLRDAISLHPLFSHVAGAPWHQLINHLIQAQVILLGDGLNKVTQNLDVFQWMSTNQVDHHVLNSC